MFNWLYLSLDCELCDYGLCVHSLPCTVHGLHRRTINIYEWKKGWMNSEDDDGKYMYNQGNAYEIILSSSEN